MAKFGTLPEVVKYTEFGETHLAFPIASREPEHHTGTNGEPLLSLVFVKPVIDPITKEPATNLAGTIRENELVKIVHDVPHASHEFTAESLTALHKQGITVSQVYPGNKMPGGRWTFVDEVPAVAQVADPAVDLGSGQGTTEGGPEPSGKVQ